MTVGVCSRPTALPKRWSDALKRSGTEGFLRIPEPAESGGAGKPSVAALLTLLDSASCCLRSAIFEDLIPFRDGTERTPVSFCAEESLQEADEASVWFSAQRLIVGLSNP